MSVGYVSYSSFCHVYHETTQAISSNTEIKTIAIMVPGSIIT